MGLSVPTYIHVDIAIYPKIKYHPVLHGLQCVHINAKGTSEQKADIRKQVIFKYSNYNEY